jgi:hypothetical protein
MSQHDNAVLESDSRPCARPVQGLLSGSSPCTLQQSGGVYSHERSPAALKGENAGGLDGSAMGKRDIDLLLPTTVQTLEDTLYGDTLIYRRPA